MSKESLSLIQAIDKSSAEKARASNAEQMRNAYQQGVKKVFDFYQGEAELASSCRSPSSEGIRNRPPGSLLRELTLTCSTKASSR
jgi:hypothetical protein